MGKFLRTLFLTILVVSGAEAEMTSRHDEKPRQAKEGELDAASIVRQIQESDYYKRLQEVETFVAGKTVLDSVSGNVGFILILTEDSWAAAYRKENEIGASFGVGAPSEEAMRQIISEEYGDASEPTRKNAPYAHEHNSVALEVNKSHGSRIQGLAYGVNTFNYAFESGRELDFHLVTDQEGRPAIRVFWEQW